MALRKPLVVLSGLAAQLPPGDTIEGAAITSVATAGSGLSGGGAVTTDFRYDLVLSAAPSGLIFSDNATRLGIDGVAQATANTALASGNAALVQANTALASGNAAQVTANTALASGNAAVLLASQAASVGLIIALS
jgi:hypothetical protein